MKGHIDTFDSPRDLGFILDRRGKYKDAEEVHYRVLQSRRRFSGLEHSMTFVAMYIGFQPAPLGKVICSAGSVRASVS